MSERHNHHVTRRVRVRIEHDVAVGPAMHDVNLRIVAVFGQIAEDAPGDLFCICHIGIAPWRAEVIHRTAGYQIAAVFGNSSDCSALKKISYTWDYSWLTHFRIHSARV